VAWELESSFRELPGTPTWKQPGLNITVSSVSLENALQRNRQPDDPRPDGSREGNLEGAYSISFDLTDRDYEDMTFANSAGDGLAQEASLAPTATWYLEGELPGGSEERFLEGAAVTNWTINYNQGEPVSVDLTITYTQEYKAGDADAPAAPSDGGISQPDKSDKVMWHSFDADLNAVNIEKLQSFSIDIANMAQPRRGQSRFIQDFVVGAYEPTLSFEAILAGTNRRELAYGSSGATKGSTDTIDETNVTLTLGSLGDYTATRAQPNSYSWSNLVSEENTTDPVDAQFVDFMKV